MELCKCDFCEDVGTREASNLGKIEPKTSNMIAYELLSKLRNLTLAGQNEDGELEWIGTTKQWRDADIDAELILREFRNEF